MRIVIAREHQTDNPTIVCKVVRNNYKCKFNESFLPQNLESEFRETHKISAVGDTIKIRPSQKFYLHLYGIAPDLTKEIDELAEVSFRLFTTFNKIIKETAKDLHLNIPNVEKIIRQEIKHRL